MANAVQLEINGSTYNVMDQIARSNIVDLQGNVSEIFNAFDRVTGYNKIVYSTVSMSGSATTTKHVYAKIYLEKGKLYTFALFEESLSSSKITIEDDSSTELLVVNNYANIPSSGVNFAWAGDTGFYNIHILTASAYEEEPSFIANRMMVYYATVLPSKYEQGVYILKAKDAETSENVDESNIKDTTDIVSYSGLNKILFDTLSYTGTVQTVKNVRAKIYLEKDVVYRFLNFIDNAISFLAGSKVTIEDDNGDILQTIVNYTQTLYTGTQFTWSRDSGEYVFHVVSSSAYDEDPQDIAEGLMVMYDKIYEKQLAFANGVSKNHFNTGHEYVAIGDSITQGAGSSTYAKTYYWILSTMILGSTGCDSRVNLGSGGRTSEVIAAYCGGIDLCLTADVTIPADRTAVAVSLNKDVVATGGGISHMNPCFIGNIEGDISYNDGYYFTRKDAARTSRTYGSGTKVISGAFRHAVNAEFMTIFVGTNDAGASITAEETVANARKIASLSKNGQYIVVIPYSDNFTSEAINLFKNEFGLKCVDMRTYMSTQSVADAIYYGLIESGSQSDWKTLFLSDGVHPNDIGHELIARKIFETVLGFVK